MNRLFFGRPPSSETADQTSTNARQDQQQMLQAIAEAQSITASAIFAALVSKGVLSAAEAAEYMGEIADALEIDVPAPVGSAAARKLRSYGYALRAAEK